MPQVMAAASAKYALPTVSNGSNGFTDDTWTATGTTNAPSRRYLHTAVWTGSEMIIWGGFDNSSLGEHRREIQSQHGHVDNHQHHQCALRPTWPHGYLDWH